MAPHATLESELSRASSLFRNTGLTGASALVNECFPAPPPAQSAFALAARVLDRAAVFRASSALWAAGDMADALLALGRIGAPFGVTSEGVRDLGRALDALAASSAPTQAVEGEEWLRTG